MTEQPDQVTVTLALSPRWVTLLAVLSEDGHGPVETVIYQLIDHAQQGVYRPGSWERGWLTQAFGYDWQSRLEPDTDDTTADGRVVFQRPVRPCPNDPPCPHPRSTHVHDAIGWYCTGFDGEGENEGCACGAIPDGSDPGEDDDDG